MIISTNGFMNESLTLNGDASLQFGDGIANALQIFLIGHTVPDLVAVQHPHAGETFLYGGIGHSREIVLAFQRVLGEIYA